jgi:proteasome accessory factor B
MKASPQVSAKTERLLNLVICLLYTRRPLTKEQIRRAVPQYASAGEAYDRMFERDKDELRELGIPLVTAQLDTFFDDEQGYRIDKRDYALPEVDFTRDELTVLGLASRTWAQASLAGPAAQALRKLASDGIERDDASLVGVEPRVRTAEPAFESARKAVLGVVPIRFDYRKGREGVEHAQARHVQPWGLTSWRGRWYLTGFDTDRADARVFRLSRIVGPVTHAGRPGSYDVPPDHDPRAMIRLTASDAGGEPIVARARVRDGAGHALRRRASAAVASSLAGWTDIEVTTTDLPRLSDEIAAFGPDVVVTSPPELIEAVVSRLSGARDVSRP